MLSYSGEFLYSALQPHEAFNNHIYTQLGRQTVGTVSVVCLGKKRRQMQVLLHSED